MTWYQIVSLIISVLSLSTLSGLLWKTFYDKKMAESDHMKKLKKEERLEELRKMIADQVLPIVETIGQVKEKLDQVGDGTLSSLRNDILKCYYDCLAKGYRNDFDYENLHDLYTSYDGLNGNSFVADIVKRFDELPTKEQYRKEHEGES